MARGTGRRGQVAVGLAALLGCAPGRSTAPAEVGPAIAPVSRSEPVARPEPAPGKTFVVRGAQAAGGAAGELAAQDGVIVVALPAGAPEVDARGRWIVPAAIDSHVHLSYLPMGRQMLAGGVAAVVDLAAPLEALAGSSAPPELEVLRSGPMITARRGYPTQDWGEDGFGLEVDDATAAARAVDTLADAGARVIKVAVVDRPGLDVRTLRAVVTRAHARGLKVAAHALFDRHARAAAAAGVDVLAHTPVEALADATVMAWSGRAVISTLAAFGGDRETIDNLRRLRAAGVTVLYGTDFGNRREPGIDAVEIELLLEAGLDGQAIVAAMTATPRAFWGLAAGSLEVGAPASFLLVDRDPAGSPAVLAEPAAVYVGGARRGVSGGT